MTTLILAILADRASQYNLGN